MTLGDTTKSIFEDAASGWPLGSIGELLGTYYELN
jgi:hypothetical protein